jgi:hypothetical protein
MKLRTNAAAEAPSAMAQSLIRIWVFIAFGSFSTIVVLPSSSLVTKGILVVCIATIATAAFYYALKKLVPFIDASALAQAKFLDTLNAQYVDVAILFSAALSLFMELGIIRWQSSVLPFFAFYKNFSLLACFMGLGLGYALAARDRIPLVIVLPLLAWQFSFMTIVRYVPDRTLTIIPFSEQLNMMATRGSGWLPIILLYGLLSIVFLITALTFMPVGQLCGRLMERRTKLRAYGLNLLGSLLGVLLMLVASFLWTPPLAWFALCFLAILVFTLRTPSDGRAFLRVGLHDRLSVAGESSLESCLFPVPNIGNWTRSGDGPDVD